MVKQYTKSEKKIDWELSLIIADKINARLGECLANVVRAFVDYRNFLPKDCALVEGFYNYGGEPGPHAWIETNERIIELSHVRDMRSAIIFGIKYYPMISRCDKEIIKLYGLKPHAPGDTLIIDAITYDDEKFIKR